MRRFAPLAALALLASCTSAAEKEQRRQQAMIEQAVADSADETDFLEDSLKLAASITNDTISALRVDRELSTDDDGRSMPETLYRVVSRTGLVCTVTAERYTATFVGDTLSCQWADRP